MCAAMTGDAAMAIVRARFARTIDVIGPQLLERRALDGYMRTIAEALRNSTDPPEINLMVVLNATADGLRSVSGNPNCPTPRSIPEWIDKWLTEIEREIAR